MSIYELPCRPDADTIATFIGRLFEHVPASHAGLVELSWTSARAPHPLNGAKLFDLGDLDALIDQAARYNSAINRNVYVSAGLRRPDAPGDRRATDEDVIAICAVKADFDDEGAFAAGLAVAERLLMPPSLIVITGRHPHTRGQIWWTLEEPATDLAQVRQIERAIAARFGGDMAVTNPSRVMRIAGSVAWPLKEGRQIEMTGLGEGVTRPEPYTLAEIAEKLRAAGALHKEAAKTNNVISLDLNDADVTLDLDALIAAAAEPGRWHKHALLAVAHLLGRGTPPGVALELLTPRLQQPGYTYQQTRRDLLPMVNGAISRGLYHAYTPPAPIAPPIEQGVAGQPPRDPFPLLAIDALDAAPPPAWRIEGYIPERGFGVLFGASGTFKSFIALDMALSVAHGHDWRSAPVTQAPAVYIAGEGTYGIANRIRVWTEHRAQGAPCAGFWLAPVAANLLDSRYVALVIERLLALPERPRLVIVDTLARSFGGGDENDAKDMNAFVAACDAIVARLECFVLAIHHSGKDSERGARGSSVLRAAADVEIKVTRGIGDMSATVTVTKQKDAEEIGARSVRLVPAETVHPETGEVISSLLPTLDETVNPQAGAPRQTIRNGRHQRTILAMLTDEGPQSYATLKGRLGVDKGSLNRALRTLRETGQVVEHGGLYLCVGGVSESQEYQGDDDE